MSTLYREIDALGGTSLAQSDYERGHDAGYEKALEQVLAILEKRGFSEAADAVVEPAAWRRWNAKASFFNIYYLSPTDREKSPLPHGWREQPLYLAHPNGEDHGREA